MQQTAQDGRTMQTFIQAYVRNMKLLNFYALFAYTAYTLITWREIETMLKENISIPSEEQFFILSKV